MLYLVKTRNEEDWDLLEGPENVALKDLDTEFAKEYLARTLSAPNVMKAARTMSALASALKEHQTLLISYLEELGYPVADPANFRIRDISHQKIFVLYLKAKHGFKSLNPQVYERRN